MKHRWTEESAETQPPARKSRSRPPCQGVETGRSGLLRGRTVQCAVAKTTSKAYEAIRSRILKGSFELNKRSSMHRAHTGKIFSISNARIKLIDSSENLSRSQVKRIARCNRIAKNCSKIIVSSCARASSGGNI